MTDFEEQLAFLHQQRAATSDEATRAMFDTLIAEKEAQIAVQKQAPLIGLLGHTSEPITVGTLSQVTGAAIGTGARATVYIDGRQGKTNDQLLVAYYQHLTTQYQYMPFQGIHEQHSTSDMLSMTMEQIYTQLATSSEIERESYAEPGLASFNAEEFLQKHCDQYALPIHQRTRLIKQEKPDPTRPAPKDVLTPVYQPVCKLSAEDLGNIAKDAQKLTFLGPQMVSEAITHAKRLVILGEPGSGKSTTLRYLAYILAHAGLDQSYNLGQALPGWTQGRLLPVFIPLLPLAQQFAHKHEHQGDAADLWDYIVDQLSPGASHPGLAAAIHEELEAGRVILLLDGLDEVAGAVLRRKVSRAIQSFAETHTCCRIVVTCRIRAYIGERNQQWQLPGWATATLADWCMGQMLKFVHGWYDIVRTLWQRSDAWRDEQVARLTRTLCSRTDLQRLGRQPLMLTIMALVDLQGGHLPEERSSLYKRCIDQLLGQWESIGKDRSQYGTLVEYIGLPDADVQSFRAVLSTAAYKAHLAATPETTGWLSRAELRTIIEDDLRRRKHPDAAHGADLFLEYTDQRAGLIQASDAAEHYCFASQPFEEYLAGIKLVSGVDPISDILKVYNDDRWRYPLLLGIQHLALSSLSTPYHLFSSLIEKLPDQPAQHAFNLLLVQEIALELGWDGLIQRDPVFRTMQRNLAQAMSRLLSERVIPAADLVRLGAALATLGDPRPGVIGFPLLMHEIPGGQFVIGLTDTEIQQLSHYEQNAFRDTSNTSVCQIGQFELARYPITNAQYELFIKAGGYKPHADWWDAAGRRWLTTNQQSEPRYWKDNSASTTYPNAPVIGVTWYEAMAFCRWLGQDLNDGYTYLLPSEAEWEYAARGIERRPYPWGDTLPDAERSNFQSCYSGITAVGCFPQGATPQGVLDLAGNIWEWTRSAYQDYPYQADDGRENSHQAAEKYYSLRGASWVNPAFLLRACFRLYDSPESPDLNVGFRVARYAQV